MDTPRLTGYPIDQEMIRRSQLDRQARRSRKQATRPQPRWLGWLFD